MKKELRSSKSLSNASQETYNDEEIEEYLNFLEYLYQDNFRSLGIANINSLKKKAKFQARRQRQSLGLLQDEIQPVYVTASQKSLSEELQKIAMTYRSAYQSE